MNVPDEHSHMPADVPQMGRRRTIWPNVIWGIPLVALIIVGYLGVRAVVNRGETVTVTFTRAAGAKAGMTKVLYQGIEAGHVTRIEPNRDGRRLDFHLRLLPAAKSGLNSNARFWLIGASPNLSDLSSLKAAISGVAIGYAPGEGGEPAEQFEGLEQEPLILPSAKGTRYVLRARSLNAVHEGSIVLFHGQAIGKVIAIGFDGKNGFRLQEFIDQPYDAIVRTGARFWKISPLRLTFGGGGITANLAPLNVLLAGGIETEVDTTNPDAPRLPPDTEFTLYSSHNAARQGLSGPAVRYEFELNGDAGALDETSAVTMLGYQIGEVESTRLAFDTRTGAPYAIATAAIYPQELHLDIDAGEQSTPEQRRATTDRALNRLIRLGYRARLQQSPPVLGEQSIQLVRTVGSPDAKLLTGPGPARFPGAPGSSDFSDITAKADLLLSKLDAIPLEDIGANLKAITGNMDRLMASPDIKDSLVHVHSTLASIDKILDNVQPQIGPLIGKLNDAAAELSGTAAALHQVVDSDGANGDASLPAAIRQITEAAQSIKTLTDYLDRHPEALIRGKRPEP